MLSLVVITDDFFHFVDLIDPARASWEKLRHSAQEKCLRLSEQMKAFQAQIPSERMEQAVKVALQNALQSANANLQAFSEAMNKGLEKPQWKAIHDRLAGNYAQLVKVLEGVKIEGREKLLHRRLVPVNYARNVYHVANGLVALVCYHFLFPTWLSWTTMLMCAGGMWATEILRRSSGGLNAWLFRRRFLKALSRPLEIHRITSATWYSTGLIVALAVGPGAPVEAALMVLAFGDPMAGLIGKRYGSKKLYKQKSYAGSAAFAVTAFLAVVLTFCWLYPAWSWGHLLGFAAVGGIAGAVAEAFCLRIDDNFAVPVVVSAVLAGMRWMAGW